VEEEEDREQEDFYDLNDHENGNNAGEINLGENNQ